VASDIMIEFYVVTGEPSPSEVDDVVREYKYKVDFIVSLGGGSVIDFGKAVAGLLNCKDERIFDFIEGIGSSTYDLEPVPFVAIPTTAGTGAEITTNSVLCVSGSFKRSFRDDKLIANLIVIDYQFLKTIPHNILIYTTMDCLTQIIESYTSKIDNAFVELMIESVLPKLASRDLMLNESGSKKAGIKI
jgi:alcohol dehydrogenase